MMRRILLGVLAMVVLTAGAMAETEPYPGLTWDSTLTDALILQRGQGFATVLNDETGGVSRDIMLAGGVSVGDYTADATLLDFREDALEGVYYCISKECSEFAFENLDAYFRRLYGEPVCFDPNKISVPGFQEMLDAADEFGEGYHSVSGVEDMKAMTGLMRKCEIKEYRVWDIDGETRLAIGYYEAGKIWQASYIGAAFTRIPNE